jgi:hypothetical protein
MILFHGYTRLFFSLGYLLQDKAVDHPYFLPAYFNQSALRAPNDKAGSMPDGAIIVKENYIPMVPTTP